MGLAKNLQISTGLHTLQKVTHVLVNRRVNGRLVKPTKSRSLLPPATLCRLHDRQPVALLSGGIFSGCPQSLTMSEEILIPNCKYCGKQIPRPRECDIWVWAMRTYCNRVCFRAFQKKRMAERLAQKAAKRSVREPLQLLPCLECGKLRQKKKWHSRKAYRERRFCSPKCSCVWLKKHHKGWWNQKYRDKRFNTTS